MKLITCLFAVAIAAAACSKAPCVCTPPFNQAVVWGRVTLDSGGVASHAPISAAAVPTGVSCVPGQMYSWGAADSLGQYRITVFGASILDSGCVYVGARFPATGQNTRDTVLGPFKLKFLPNPPFDSVNVDLVIPH